jgi:hypothetical protein
MNVTLNGFIRIGDFLSGFIFATLGQSYFLFTNFQEA